MSPAPTYRTRERVVTLPGGVRVTCLEVVDVDTLLDRAIHDGAPPPYGAVLWASGVALARRLVERGDLRGRTVVDVGAGVGVCSLVAAHLGASAVALDHDAVARELLEEAAQRQGVHVDTRDFDVYGDEALPPGDVVVFADLLYETPLARATARRVLEALARGSDVLVGDPQRIGREDLLSDLRAGGVEAHFETELVEVPDEGQAQRVGVLALSGARS